MQIDAATVAYFLLGIFVVMVLLSVYRRRESIAQKVRQGFLSIGTFVLTVLIARQFTHDGIKLLLIAFIAEIFVFLRTKPRHSRYISRIEKRKAIARYERSGRRYNPRLHELDHIVPHSRGGVSKADNLRVIERDRNRQKSARSPWWDVFSR